MIGTVPYLGLYLSDLTYIDSAYPNTITIENNTDESPNSTVKLINFEKHRKEFEVLAQIKLFQSAANAYTSFQAVPRFRLWFDSVRTYTEAERFVLKDFRLILHRFFCRSVGICRMKSNQKKPPTLIIRHGTMEINRLKRKLSKNHWRIKEKNFFCRILPRYPSEASLESLSTPNSNRKTNHVSTIATNSGGSLRSSPSSASLDKLSTTSNQSFNRFQFPLPSSKTEKVKRKHLFSDSDDMQHDRCYSFRNLSFIIQDHHLPRVF